MIFLWLFQVADMSGKIAGITKTCYDFKQKNNLFYTFLLFILFLHVPSITFCEKYNCHLAILVKTI